MVEVEEIVTQSDKPAESAWTARQEGKKKPVFIVRYLNESCCEGHYYYRSCIIHFIDIPLPKLILILVLEGLLGVIQLGGVAAKGHRKIMSFGYMRRKKNIFSTPGEQ